MQTLLILGATGRTGRSLLERRLGQGGRVRAIVRRREGLPESTRNHPRLELVEASVLELSDRELTRYVQDCDGVVSCLGHTLDCRGLFGAPRRLCADATSRVCRAIEENRPARPVRFVLMNSVGVQNPDLEEKRSPFDRGILAFLRRALPPHKDNELAAGRLHRDIGRQSPYIEWCVVRPDTLTDEGLSACRLTASPTTSLLRGRPTARANVARFMIDLVDDDRLWDTWKFRMPVIMDAIDSDA
ncbi:MAG TPA: NAD(P)-dependent oxidoreductase [Deltaproteobacteria bacterium]|nr:NAD(P)-dependent oxidoreductase [Deltaproteobacteria bacterium]